MRNLIAGLELWGNGPALGIEYDCVMNEGSHSRRFPARDRDAFHCMPKSIRMRV